MSSLSNEDSAALADALRKLLQEQYGFATRRRQQLRTPAGELPPVWRHLVELGLGSLLLPESQGGFGGGIADFQRVQRELGRALVVAPWMDTAICARALLLAASPQQQAGWLPAVADGSMSMALAHAEQPGLDSNLAPATARQDATGWLLDGCKSAVPHAACVSHYVASARLPDGGRAWFLVDARQSAIQREDRRLLDDSWTSDLRFEGAQAQRLEGAASAQEVARVEAAVQAMAVAGWCADALGAAEAAHEMTVQYLRTRKQFGQALGDYQALRHRVAEMYMVIEQARSAAEMAREAAESSLATDAGADGARACTRLAAQAQLVACEGLTWLQQQAIQLHGGMGMTDELPIGHGYRRMLVIDALSGGAPAALAQLVAMEA